MVRMHQCLPLSQGFTHSDSDHNLYYKGLRDNKTILVVYVDELFVTGGNKADIAWIIQQLQDRFDIRKLGLVQKYIGVEFVHLPHGIFLHQTPYILQILEDSGMLDCRPEHVPLPAGLHLFTDMNSPPINSTIYCQLVGKLIFLTTTRPDLAFLVGLVSRFMTQPQQAHLDVVYYILRYVKKTATYGLFYSRHDTDTIQGFNDAY